MSEAIREGLHLPACLIIMDGFGLAEEGPGNAISQAHTPTLDHLMADFPTIAIHASEEEVGLPVGQMGNSEVGHLNIGAGRVVYQELTRIDKACREGSIKENEALCEACKRAAEPGAVLHIMGLLSDGGVHSSNAHLYALIRMAAEMGVAEIAVHCFMDGRDVPPSSGADYVQQLLDEIAKVNEETASTAFIASISGRYYAMDRDNRWDRVKKAYDVLTGVDSPTNRTPVQVMTDSYANDVTDEFVVPTSLYGRGIRSQDAVIFFNFRPDRAREITHALVDEDFAGFERERKPLPYFVCMTQYDETMDIPVAFEKHTLDHVLADVIADAGLTQYHIAETEKYAHVTFFLNGGVEEPKEGETRKLIPSPKVATYDMQPSMSEPEVATTLAAAIRNDEADFYIVNFANCDMVGHTGVIPAAVAAVEAVDSGVKKVLEAIKEKGGVALLTADHGNADKMIADDGTPHTAHTTALVPFILVDFSGQGYTLKKDPEAALCNIAPTLLQLAGVEAPSQMTAESLLAK